MEARDKLKFRRFFKKVHNLLINGVFKPKFEQKVWDFTKKFAFINLNSNH